MGRTELHTNREDAQRVAHWVKKYSEIVDTYEEFVQVIQRLVVDGLKEIHMDDAEVTGRAKDILSFKEKIQRPGKLYNEPLKQITDLAGIRVVVLYESEMKKVQKFLSEEFEIDAENSIDKREELDDDRFGYRSIHSIVTLKPERTRLREFKKFKGLKAEIQVRTVLQHAWAAAAHSLLYKSGRDPGRIYRRQFVRLASLLELVNEQFVSLRESEQGRWTVVSGKIRMQKFDEVPTDPMSLKVYCERARMPRRVKAVANKLKLAKHPQRDEQMIYKELLGVCELCEIRSIADLDRRLRDTLPFAARIFKARDSHVRSTLHRPWLTHPEYLITTLLICTQDRLPSRKGLQDKMDIDPVFVDGILYAAKAYSPRKSRGKK